MLEGSFQYAESRYALLEGKALLEGEALVVVVTLYKARYFVSGCESLTNLEKAMHFRLDILYVPGRFHKGPDAMSRALCGIGAH